MEATSIRYTPAMRECVSALLNADRIGNLYAPLKFFYRNCDWIVLMRNVIIRMTLKFRSNWKFLSNGLFEVAHAENSHQSLAKISKANCWISSSGCYDCRYRHGTVFPSDEIAAGARTYCQICYPWRVLDFPTCCSSHSTFTAQIYFRIYFRFGKQSQHLSISNAWIMGRLSFSIWAWRLCRVMNVFI